MNPPDSRPPRPQPPVPSSFFISRRHFLQRCAAIAAVTGLPAWFVESQLARAAEPTKTVSPNARPRIALVGCGGMGRADANNALPHGDIVAVCDVDDSHAAAAAEQFTLEGKAPERYADFRRVLDRKDVDVVITATPDHWHTLVNYGAALAGKDVYGEKPLTLTIDEGKRLVKAVRKQGAILQTGTQQRSSVRFRLACELIRNGRIGQLKEATVWLPAGLREGPFSPAPVPNGLNWDFWLGPAPKADYVPQRCHSTFRFWYDYSGGTITDWGAHHIDIACWAIGLPAPREISATPGEAPIPGGYSAYAQYVLNYTYANGVKLTVRTTTDDSIYGEVKNKEGQRNGIRFEGTDGWIWVNRNQITASNPDLLRAPLPEKAVRLYKSDDHMENFFSCVRARKQPICDVETGHRSASMCHLGVIALRTGLRLTWDEKREKFTGDNARQGNKHLAREMRKPYTYSFVG